MLPGFLESTYKRYKNDTSVFLEWLSENAQRCGYLLNTNAQATGIDASTKTPRLKGKARKQAKEAAASSNNLTAAKPAKEERRLVNVKELLPLASTVVKSKDPRVTVPTRIIQAGLRAVSARKRCMRFYRNKTASDDINMSRANESHSYFTALMEEVIITLQPRFAVSAGAASVQHENEVSQNTFEDLENRFAALEVEDPPEQEAAVAPASKVSEIAPEMKYELQAPTDKTDVEEEKRFATFCLIDDLGHLRIYLEALWTEYVKEEIDLVTVAVTTDTAFQLAIRMQEEFLATYPIGSDYQNVLSTILAALSSKDQIGSGEYELEVDDSVAEWMFAPAHSLLDNFCDVVQPGQVPVIKRGHFGVYDPLADRSTMNDV